MLFDRGRRRMVATIAGLMLAACGGGEARDGETAVRVYAAASLVDVMGEIGAAWEAEGHLAPVFNFAGTSLLARQLENGAAADVFISADEAWMDEVEAQGLIVEGSRRNVASNALVLVAPAGSESAFDPSIGGLAEALGGGRLSLAELAVPAGRYARDAMQASGDWAAVEPRAVYSPDVRAALRLVEAGEAAAGVVYRTDAMAAGARIRVVATFPVGSHAPIVYPAGRISGGDDAGFLAFLGGDDANVILERHGFSRGEGARNP